MDPFSAEGELVNIHTAFVQGQYQSVLDDFDISSFSSSNKLPIQVLKYRAQCELGQQSKVASTISDADAKSSPDLAAVKAYASYLKSPSDDGPAILRAEELSESQGDSLTVQLLCGTVLARAGKADQALALLAKHQGSLDAVALIVQIHLMQNRTDLAVKEAKNARSFAQDALLVNLAEAWIGVRQGGDQYQKSFYVFEELAQAPSSQATYSLIAQAVSELHMGRLEEAEAALSQALEKEPHNTTALASKLVLDTIVGKGSAESRGKLSSVDKSHEVLKDLEEKRNLFQAACEKYKPKFAP
ncbi:hypothetical protein K431DRAFT_311729 [Polychaeton citri CBS 116435]|uniref:Coatomer subunit epsilon n=1 Tax=Polychaeton citri CBS 116435 TaxID=1314669 RepID=A0A9P4QAB2_9PEZI|nr:hypothetical protein K431DRAFT_311729 [Polychaeton citri CBS 116435]